MLNPGPVPVDQKLLSRKVADWLASRIISGEFAPGERLYETRIAAEAEVSRSPVREALRLLAGEGLVELVPRLGAQVASMSPADATNVYAARLLIEPPCAAMRVSYRRSPGVNSPLMIREASQSATLRESSF